MPQRPVAGVHYPRSLPSAHHAGNNASSITPRVQLTARIRRTSAGHPSKASGLAGEIGLA